MIAIIIILLLGLSCPPISSAYDGELLFITSLDEDSNYILSWSPFEDEIVFEVQVRTAGYVGLGFSPNGGMTGSDVVVGWVDNQAKVHFRDLHATSNSMPIADESQDYKVIRGYKNETHTVLRFSRPYLTCDESNDLEITGETTRVIWAYDPELPDLKNGKMPKYHDFRGVKSLLLKQGARIQPTATLEWDVTVKNVEISEKLHTLYWCKIFKAPKLSRKHQIIGFTPVIEKGHLGTVHHMILYECNIPGSSNMFEKYINHGGAQCHSPNMPISWFYCLRNSLFGYAPGSQGFALPEQAGVAIGEEHGSTTYFLLEIHYDNPKFENIIDSSGMKLLLTDQLRPYDAGNIVVGSSVGIPALAIPPNDSNFKMVNYCSGDCTRQEIPPGGIKVFSVLLHAHLIGRGIKVQHIRNGKELQPLSEDNKYDFNYQQDHNLVEERTILPGDSFITTCAYNSTGRKLPTFAGLSTNEEMCLAFMSYYPRVRMTGCISTPSWESLIDGLGLKVSGLEKMKVNKLSKLFRSSSLNSIEELDTEMYNKLNLLDNSTSSTILAEGLRRLKIVKPIEWRGRSVYEFMTDEDNWKNQDFIQRYRKITESSFRVKCNVKGKEMNNEAINEYSYPSYVPYEEPRKNCTEGVSLAGFD